jgi:hypothetical protein
MSASDLRTTSRCLEASQLAHAHEYSKLSGVLGNDATVDTATRPAAVIGVGSVLAQVRHPSLHSFNSFDISALAFSAVSLVLDPPYLLWQERVDEEAKSQAKQILKRISAVETTVNLRDPLCSNVHLKPGLVFRSSQVLRLVHTPDS